MYPNIPYVETKRYDFYHAPIVNNPRINIAEKKSPTNIQHIFDAYNHYGIITPTLQTIKNIQKINNWIKTISKVQCFIQLVSDDLTLPLGKTLLRYSFCEVYGTLRKMHMDVLSTDISHQEECLFIYGKRKEVEFFYNFFVEDNKVDAMVVAFTADGREIVEGDVHNCLEKLLEIMQTAYSYALIS